MTRKDPYQYFRIEARELCDGLSRGVLELEKAGASRELTARLLRQAHTLKGAARVVKLAGVAELAHAVEDALAPYRESANAVPRDAVDGLLKLTDALAARLVELDAPAVPSARPEAQAAAPTPRSGTVRLEVGEVDTVLERLSEAATGLAALRAAVAALQPARRLAQRLAEEETNGSAAKLRAPAQEITAALDRFCRAAPVALDQTEREVLQAHERAGRLRLLQAGAGFDFLERAARDAAALLGKQVRFEAVGGDHRLDAPVLSALQDALLHLVRNAVAHGLEAAAARATAGKPAAGLVRIEAMRRGGRVVFSCRDDGRGLDTAAIRRAAISRGKLPASAPDPLGVEAAAQLLLRGGVSTTGEVTEVSGRGVGLDAVREAVERLHGEIRITSEPERGTTVEIEVPYSLSTFPALAVTVDGIPALIPFEGVRRAVRIADADVARSPGGDTVRFESAALPFLPLRVAWGRPRDGAGGAHPAVVVQAAAGMAVVAVDQILGVRETVARPLPELAPADAVAAGAALDVEGNPCLVLDPEALVRAARARGGESAAPAARERQPILVVDDSLTTRMLEQSILESAGYAVEVAVSAEEGLAKARRKRYGLFLVDVEMPGMNGFELLETLRGDAALRDIPALLVTSRASSEDRQRGAAAGARDYIVKGEFDQARLLGRIRELLG